MQPGEDSPEWLGLTVLLMLANSFPLNSTMEYTAPFTSFSATVCSFPGGGRDTLEPPLEPTLTTQKETLMPPLALRPLAAGTQPVQTEGNHHGRMSLKVMCSDSRQRPRAARLVHSSLRKGDKFHCIHLSQGFWAES